MKTTTITTGFDPDQFRNACRIVGKHDLDLGPLGQGRIQSVTQNAGGTMTVTLLMDEVDR